MGIILEVFFEAFTYCIQKKITFATKKTICMKKNILIALLMLSFSFTHAQINFGIKAEFSALFDNNDLKVPTFDKYALTSINGDFTNGFHAGVFGRIYYNKLYFQPELLYAFGKKGLDIKITSTEKGNSNSITFQKNATVKTIDIPLLIGYKLLDIKVFAGPKIRLNSGSTVEYKSINENGYRLADLTKDIKPAQLGFEVGFGVDLLMMTLDIRYNLINEMYQTKLNNVTIDNVPANTFVVSLGWKIIGK